MNQFTCSNHMYVFLCHAERLRKLLDASPKTFGDFRCGELQARNSPRSPPALQSPPALLEPRLGDIRRLQDGYSGYPHSPPSQILQAPQPLKEPRGDMSGARLSKSSPMGTLGNTTPSTPLPAPNTMDTDTVRFLCEYVAKEEARLGLSAPKWAIGGFDWKLPLICQCTLHGLERVTTSWWGCEGKKMEKHKQLLYTKTCDWLMPQRFHSPITVESIPILGSWDILNHVGIV